MLKVLEGMLEKLKQKVLRVSGKVDQYQEAITFAEAGESEHAREVLQVQPESQEIHKLLVVGQEGTFAQEMIDYALDMAKRMSYEIVALNTAPFSCDTFKLFSSSRDQLCVDFQELSTKNAAIFQQEAAREGISFSHVIKFSEIDEAIESVCKEYGDVAFVVSESQEQQADSRIEQGERLQQKLVVYSIV